jgi:hypothetical protein
MKGSCKGWQKKSIGFSSRDGASNDAIKGELDHKQAAAGRVSLKIIFIQSSSEESNRLNDSSAKAKASELNKMTTMTRPSKPRKSQNKRTNASGGGTKSKKTATAPVFKAEKTNPFCISQTSVDFGVRGKPHPQYHDKLGWNRTRYNPSKTLQKQFGCVAIEQCLNHANQVPDFGPDVRIRMEINFCFPPPPKLVKSKTLRILIIC